MNIVRKSLIYYCKIFIFIITIYSNINNISNINNELKEYEINSKRYLSNCSFFQCLNEDNNCVDLSKDNLKLYDSYECIKKCPLNLCYLKNVYVCDYPSEYFLFSRYKYEIEDSSECIFSNYLANYCASINSCYDNNSDICIQTSPTIRRLTNGNCSFECDKYQVESNSNDNDYTCDYCYIKDNKTALNNQCVDINDNNLENKFIIKEKFYSFVVDSCPNNLVYEDYSFKFNCSKPNYGINLNNNSRICEDCSLNSNLIYVHNSICTDACYEDGYGLEYKNEFEYSNNCIKCMNIGMFEQEGYCVPTCSIEGYYMNTINYKCEPCELIFDNKCYYDNYNNEKGIYECPLGYIKKLNEFNNYVCELCENKFIQNNDCVSECDVGYVLKDNVCVVDINALNNSVNIINDSIISFKCENICNIFNIDFSKIASYNVFEAIKFDSLKHIFNKETIEFAEECNSSLLDSSQVYCKKAIFNIIHLKKCCKQINKSTNSYEQLEICTTNSSNCSCSLLDECIPWIPCQCDSNSQNSLCTDSSKQSYNMITFKKLPISTFQGEILSSNCYKPIALCKNKKKNENLINNISVYLKYPCCTSSNLTNCIKHFYCQQLNLKDIEDLKVCDEELIDNCITSDLYQIYSAIKFNCCSSSSSVNCLNISSVNCNSPIINHQDDTYLGQTIYELPLYPICDNVTIKDNCFRSSNCTPLETIGIENNKYICCDEEKSIETNFDNCSTLSNCIVKQPCKSNTYRVDDEFNIISNSSIEDNCYTPKPCCISKSPAFPIDCDIDDLLNDDAVEIDNILYDASKYFEGILDSRIRNIKQSILNNYVGKSAAYIIMSNKAHKCVASDGFKYVCCSDDNVDTSTNCHNLSNCVKPKIVTIDENNHPFKFNLPNSIELKDAIKVNNSILYPKPCCDDLNKFNGECDLSEDCIHIEAPCCNTGRTFNLLSSNCHFLENCISIKPCCSSDYNLKYINLPEYIKDKNVSNIDEYSANLFPQSCTNLPNCYDANSCCNVLGHYSVKYLYYNELGIKKSKLFSSSLLGNNKYLLNLTKTSNNINPYFNNPMTNFKDSNFPNNCLNESIYQDSAYKNIAYEDDTYFIGGLEYSCIRPLKCCDETSYISDNKFCHNLKNCIGLNNVSNPNVLKDISCKNTEYDNGKMLTIDKKNMLYCKEPIFCCKNPNNLYFDSNKYNCDDSMKLLYDSNTSTYKYDPSSETNCIKSKICCSPSLTENCSNELNCYPKPYPRLSSSYKYKDENSKYKGVEYNESNTFYYNSYEALPCCNDDFTNTNCSNNKEFCIPSLPCCSNEEYNTSGLTTNTNDTGCVEKYIFFNCSDKAPKCTSNFNIKGCSNNYNTWNPTPCEPSLNKDLDLKDYIDNNKLCIHSLSCCTEEYKYDCHNLSNCLKEDRKCLGNEYYDKNRLIVNDIETAYTCTNYRNSVKPIQCCTETIKSDCIEVNYDRYPNCNFKDYKYECGCVPPMPCCSEYNKNVPCHKLENCIRQKPCCLFEDNYPMNTTILSTTTPTKACSGCPKLYRDLNLDSNNYILNNEYYYLKDNSCCKLEYKSDCTIDLSLTLESYLCPSIFPDLSLKENDQEVSEGCVKKLPCCSIYNENNKYNKFPIGCSMFKESCDDNNRPCCLNNKLENPLGCVIKNSEGTNCLNYLPFCKMIDNPILKYEGCSTSESCLVSPIPCCVTDKYPKGCTKNKEETLDYYIENIDNSQKPPCCYNGNTINGPYGCAVPIYDTYNMIVNCDSEFYPCCVKDIINNPLGCKLKDNNKCFDYYPLCTIEEKPLNCSKDNSTCLPSLPCCDKDKNILNNCVDKELLKTFDNELYPEYPYCYDSSPRCTSKYNKIRCNSYLLDLLDPDIFNLNCCEESISAYFPMPCCDNLLTDQTVCSNYSDCIKPQFCCSDEYDYNKFDFFNIDISSINTNENLKFIQLCNNLSNCIKSLPRCIEGVYEIENECSILRNAYEPYPCCEDEGKFVFSLDKTKDDPYYCVKELNGVMCIKPMPCCLDDDPDNYNIKLNCHNMINCISPKPECRCNSPEYLRTDCAILPTLPESSNELFTPLYCCDTKYKNYYIFGKTEEERKENEIAKKCSTIKSKCKQVGRCCLPNSGKLNTDDGVCKESFRYDIDKLNCDYLNGCITQGPKCIDKKYMINKRYPDLWNNQVNACRDVVDFYYDHVLCEDVKYDDPTSVIKNICIIELPCCLIDNYSPEFYPCHNLSNCIKQNKFCCDSSKMYTKDCVNLDIDEEGKPLPGVLNPTIIYCIPPKPCCDFDIKEDCVEPEYELNMYDNESLNVPTNCILPKNCCSDFDYNDCNQLSNCIRKPVIDIETSENEEASSFSSEESTTENTQDSQVIVDIIDIIDIIDDETNSNENTQSDNNTSSSEINSNSEINNEEIITQESKDFEEFIKNEDKYKKELEFQKISEPITLEEKQEKFLEDRSYLENIINNNNNNNNNNKYAFDNNIQNNNNFNYDIEQKKIENIKLLNLSKKLFNQSLNKNNIKNTEFDIFNENNDFNFKKEDYNKDVDLSKNKNENS